MILSNIPDTILYEILTFLTFDEKKKLSFTSKFMHKHCVRVFNKFRIKSEFEKLSNKSRIKLLQYRNYDETNILRLNNPYLNKFFTKDIVKFIISIQWFIKLSKYNMIHHVDKAYQYILCSIFNIRSFCESIVIDSLKNLEIENYELYINNITEMDLSFINEIIPELNVFTNLKDLTINSCTMNKIDFPMVVTTFVNLEKLYMYPTEFNNIPIHILNLKKLKRLTMVKSDDISYINCNLYLRNHLFLENVDEQPCVSSNHSGRVIYYKI